MKAHPTTHKGVPMCSQLDATWAQVFDRAGWQWTYLKDRRTAGYAPAFRIQDRRHIIYVQIQTPLGDQQLQAARYRMELVWSVEPTASLWIIQGFYGDDGYQMDCCEPPLEGDETSDPILAAWQGWKTIDTDMDEVA